eukprot:PITA_36406
MLSNDGLQKELWTEAVATTCYMINRSPSMAIGCNIPQELDVDNKLKQDDVSDFQHIQIETTSNDSLDEHSSDANHEQEVVESSKSEKWKAAMKDEMMALGNNGTWDLVELPKDKKTMGCKWVFKLKRGVNDTEERYKAKLVGKGFSQKASINFHEIFSRVVKIVSIRIVLALVALLDLELQQLDVKTTFLHGYLDEEIYME